MVRLALLLICGLSLWIATQFLALSVGGGGHGWSSPYLVSLPLIIIYPLVILRAFSAHAQNAFVGVALIVIAIPLDVSVIQSTFGELKYLNNVWQIAPVKVLAWIALWFGWQVLAIYSFIRHKSPV